MSRARRPSDGRPTLHVAVVDARGRPAPAPGLARWLARAAPRGAHGTVTIALVGNAAMRRLNARFRGKDAVTDVLSFPLGHSPVDAHISDPLRRPLGDLAISLGVARRQAIEEGHNLATELRVLALHGLLHLLGYDHERDDGQMRRVEERLRRRAGLRRGLIDRGRHAGRR